MFESIIKELEPLLRLTSYRICRRINSKELDDVKQELLIIAWEAYKKCNPAIKPHKQYMCAHIISASKYISQFYQYGRNNKEAFDDKVLDALIDTRIKPEEFILNTILRNDIIKATIKQLFELSTTDVTHNRTIKYMNAYTIIKNIYAGFTITECANQLDLSYERVRQVIEKYIKPLLNKHAKRLGLI